MTDPGDQRLQHPAGGTPEERARHIRELDQARRNRVVKVTAALVLLALLVAFVIQNYNQYGRVHYVFLTRTSRILWVILVSGVLGWISGYLIGRPSKRHRRVLKEYDKDHELK